jgi:ribonuclease HI
MSWFTSPESMWVAIVYSTKLRGNLKRLFHQSAKRVACLAEGDSVYLKKGWWTTGDLKSIQTKGDLEIWCSNNIHDDEFQIPSPLLWVPVPSSANTRLTTYLQNMPGSQYLTVSIPVADTDGTYRRARDGNISSPMGAGVTWKGKKHPNRSVCVRGNYASSTRAELAAIELALQQANITESVILLVDSTATLRHIDRFQSHEFRPDWESCKDPDIMKIIIDIICARQAFGSQTLIVKVHGHSAHPLHTLADSLAVEGAETEEE